MSKIANFGHDIGHVGAYSTVVSTSITRPADTTQYGIGDVWSSSTSAPATPEIEDCARGIGGSGSIVRLSVAFNKAETTPPDFELYLFPAAVTVDNDNAAFSPTFAELQTRTAYISSADAENEVTVNSAFTLFEFKNIVIPFVCAAASMSLYPIVVLANTYTPTNAEIVDIQLSILQD